MLEAMEENEVIAQEPDNYSRILEYSTKPASFDKDEIDALIIIKYGIQKHEIDL